MTPNKRPKSYNRDGRLASRTDQRGSKLEFDYNGRRQQTLQKASTLGGESEDTHFHGRGRGIAAAIKGAFSRP